MMELHKIFCHTKKPSHLRGLSLENLFTGFAQDNLRKVLIDFVQMPGIASQKDGGAVVVFGNAYLIGVKELFIMFLSSHSTQRAV